jgi:DNA repair exonuclease SbcCD nuclease subunit
MSRSLVHVQSSVVRLVWRTDVHLSDTSPSSRKDDWADTVLGKLRQVATVAEKMRAAAVLDGGDFFHVKSPGRNTHELVRRVAEVHASYPCPVYGNVGNHDVVYGDYSYLGQQPLGVLFATNVFRRCYDEHEVVFQTEPDVHGHMGVPSSGGTKVRVVGIPYHGTTYDMERFRSIRKGDEDFLVCMAHVLASEKGGSMFEGEDIVKYADLADLAPDVWLFGHWHKDQGVVDVGRTKVVNIGSLTRGSLSQDEITRKPACAVLEFEAGKAPVVRVVRLKVGLPEEVFDVEGRVRSEARTMTMDSFVESIREKLLSDQGGSVEDVVRGMDSIPEKVREKVLLCLEKAGEGS